MTINCILADDEPVARTGMKRLIQQVSFLNLVGEAKDALEINHYLSNQNVDLIFLDIQMPVITGIEFLKSLTHAPKVIFVTAYQDYAIEAYELDVLDYLLKPVTLPRFLKAANKAKEYFEYVKATRVLKADQPDRDHFFIKCNKRIEKIRFDEILFIEAMLNYVTIHTPGSKYITYSSIKNIFLSLPSQKFMRIHKSYIVSISKIERVSEGEVKVGDRSLPVSRANKKELVSRFRIKK